MKNTHLRFKNMIKRRLSLDNLGSPLKIVSEGDSFFNPQTQELELDSKEINTSGVRIGVKSYQVDNLNVLIGDVDFEVSWEAYKEVEVIDEEGNISTVIEYYETPLIQPTDLIIYEDEIYRILNVKARKHGGVLLGYKVRGRLQ